MRVDPTFVDGINFDSEYEVDPRRVRQQGVARHGFTPFDCPVVSEITDDLWMGGYQRSLLLPLEVKHVVSLYPWGEYPEHEELRSRTSFWMYDSTDQGFEQVDMIAGWVNELRRDGVTLVHCQAGLNRSGLITARALILKGGEPAQVIRNLRSRRSPAVLCNPAFEEWLTA